MMMDLAFLDSDDGGLEEDDATYYHSPRISTSRCINLKANILREGRSKFIKTQTQWILTDKREGTMDLTMVR